MPLLADLIAAFSAGLLALVVAREHSRLRPFVGRRVDPSVATGLLLAVTLVCGLVLGILAVLVQRVAAIQHVDDSVAAWGHDHRGSASTSGLRAITELGNIRIVIAVAAVFVLVDAIRSRNRWSFLFLLVVLAGMEASQLGVKELVGRLRPTLNPDASLLGPSFPSGHSATAAAFYAAAALIIGRSLTRPVRQVVIAAAVAIAVAVAGSRVLLDLHWLSDVVGGLSLGWGWFALCAVIFGGRLLGPTAAADLASAHAGAPNRDGPARAADLGPPSRVPRTSLTGGSSSGSAS